MENPGKITRLEFYTPNAFLSENQRRHGFEDYQSFDSSAKQSSTTASAETHLVGSRMTDLIEGRHRREVISLFHSSLYAPCLCAYPCPSCASLSPEHVLCRMTLAYKQAK